MGSIPSRYQRKSATAYQKQQEAEAMALYRQMSQMQAPVVPTPAQSADKPGVVSQVASGAWHGVKKAVHEMFNSLDELSTFVAHKLPDSLGGGKGERHNFSNLLNAITGNAASGATLKAGKLRPDEGVLEMKKFLSQKQPVTK